MRRRGFDPLHIAQGTTPPHAEYDRIFSHIFNLCGNGGGCIFALAGARGTGKTQMATNIAGKLLQPRPTETVIRKATPLDTWRGEVAYTRANVGDEETWPLYTTAKGFFLAVKESWNEPSDGKPHRTETQVMEHYLKPCLLVIDEAHVRMETKWEDDQLTDLVDRRCHAGRDTILISNMGRDAFSKSLGPSIVSRIHQFGEFFECGWKSFRERKVDAPAAGKPAG